MDSSFIFRTISSLPSTSTGKTSSTETIDPIMEDENADADYDNMMFGETQSVTSDSHSVGSFSTGNQTPNTKKLQANETSEILREFLASRPKVSDFIPQKPIDDIQYFLDSIAVTMRRLSPLSIARIKLKIANIVGEEEIAWAEQNPVEIIYIDPNTQNQLTQAMNQSKPTVQPQNQLTNETNDDDDMDQQ